tara:strand:+ start:4020 stop:5054 length:1035 start_codon:yes stop_codon:yes gene_type:complete
MKILILFLSTCSFLYADVSWRNILKKKTVWYGSKEASDIAGKVMLYQRENGGWPKNQDMSDDLSKSDRKKLRKKRDELEDTTIDNGATHTPLRFLTRVWKQKADPTIEASLHQGLSFLLKSQYSNGGWPQRRHDSGYGRHITYNDGAMIGVMAFLRDLLQEGPSFLTSVEKEQIKEALTKGLDCLLKSQIRIDAKPTVWCAQHDRKTLLPAKARSYEHPSFSGGESAGIVKYLMQIKDPSPEVRAAIEGAVTWLDQHKIEGIVIERKDGNRIVTHKKDAPVLWARFYDLKTARPIFSGRDGIIKFSFDEIEAERRNGYAWYVGNPRSILEKDYPKWKESLKDSP